MIVHAQWVKEFGQIELRTCKPSTGLKPSSDVFVHDLLGLVRQQWWKGRHIDAWQAVFGYRDVFERHDPPLDYQIGLPNQVAAMAVVESKWRERNPGLTLRVYGDAPQILAGVLHGT